MRARGPSYLISLWFGIAATAAAAEPAPFGYVYIAETEAAGETELSVWATDRRGKDVTDYQAQDYRLELEHGVTRRFQAAAYVELASHHLRPLEASAPAVDRSFAFSGLQAEFIYQVADPARGLGLALYAEPGWSRISKETGASGRELEIELKAIIEKDFPRHHLRLASNLTLEPEWAREEPGAHGIPQRTRERELAFEIATGLAYRLTSNWSLGVETRYHSLYPNWTRGLHRENYAIYAGPTVSFEDRGWSLTGTWLPQLHGSPHDASSSLELHDHEKSEVRVKVSREF